MDGTGEEAHPPETVDDEAAPDAHQPACLVSVVVLSYNSEGTIRRCLDSLLGQRTDLEFEVLVVDSSRDSTARIVAGEYPRAKLIHLDRRTLPGAARNIGIRNATGSVIAFLASDCVASTDWLELRFRSHQAGFTGVGGAITNANPESIVGWANYFMEYLFCLPSRPREVIKDKVIHNLSYKREIFARLGLFPTHLEVGEDTVFNRRMMLHGEPVLFEPQVLTGHINPTSVGPFVTHQYRHGLDFARACQRGELAFFRIRETPLGKVLGLYHALVRYPLLRIKSSFRVVARQEPRSLPRLLACLPWLVLGVLSAARGATAGLYGRAPEATAVFREELS